METPVWSHRALKAPDNSVMNTKMGSNLGDEQGTKHREEIRDPESNSEEPQCGEVLRERTTHSSENAATGRGASRAGCWGDQAERTFHGPARGRLCSS